jgi:hypothetical protein
VCTEPKDIGWREVDMSCMEDDTGRQPVIYGRLILCSSSQQRRANGGDVALATAEVCGQDRKKQVKSIQVFHKYDLKVVISISVSPTQIKSNPTNTNKTVRIVSEKTHKDD